MTARWGKWSAAVIAATGLTGCSASGPPEPGTTTPPGAQTCPPNAEAVTYSDALDKATAGDATVGGLSSLAYDSRAGAWASTVDNHGADPARIWFFQDPARPRIVGGPLVLELPGGAAPDLEGLAVLPDGDYLVSSETEPSIRVFGRDGVQKASLEVPDRFAVAGGEATTNETLEGLTIAPSGRQVIAAMEGALSGDGDATLHRFLVYDAGADGAWRLSRQIGYRAQAGHRIPEIAAYGSDSLLVEEAAFDQVKGNTIQLYAVSGTDRAADISAVPNLSQAPGSVVAKTLVADVTACPALAATAEQPQTNPLMANYEAMAVSAEGGVTLLSDDNFAATQVTRVLNLTVRLP